MKKTLQSAVFSLLSAIAFHAESEVDKKNLENTSVNYKNSLMESVVCEGENSIDNIKKIISLQKNNNNPYDYVSGDNKFKKIDDFLNKIVSLYESNYLNSELYDRVILGWNYCGIYNVDNSGIYFNSSDKNQYIIPASMSTGFKNFGFSSDDSYIIVPSILANISIGPTAYQDFFHKIFNKQCFPHPDTGRTIKEGAGNSLLPVSFKPYLFSIEEAKSFSGFSCDSDNKKVVIPPDHGALIKSKIISIDRLNINKKIENLKINNKKNKKTLLIKKTKQNKKIISKPSLTIKKNRVKVFFKKMNKSINSPELVDNSSNKYNKIKSGDVFDLAYDLSFVNPESEFITDYVNLNNKQNGVFEINKVNKVNKNIKYKKYLSGSAFLIKPLNENKEPSIGTSINLKLTSNFNVYTSLKLYPEYKDIFAYSWGMKYRKSNNQWAFQVNNWGPLEPGDGFDFENSVYSVGYRINSKYLKSKKLASTLSINNAHSSNYPWLSSSLQWYASKNIYIRTSASLRLGGSGDVSWSLSFGYVDWRPNKFRYEYHNYGSEFYSKNGFVNDGLFQISYGWVW